MQVVDEFRALTSCFRDPLAWGLGAEAMGLPLPPTHLLVEWGTHLVHRPTLVGWNGPHRGIRGK